MIKSAFSKLKKEKPKPSELSPYRRGLYYEDVVCRWLKSRGYRILDRNLSNRKRGELDIVAKDGDTLVFVEVKARQFMSSHLPLKSIHPAKRQKILYAARNYLWQLQDMGVRTDMLSVRYDVVSLSFDEEGNPVALDHYVSYMVARNEDF